MEARDRTDSPLKRRISRRAVVGGTLAAGSVAVAYAALGNRFDFFAAADAPSVAKADAQAIKKESVRISHLLRRAGFGASKEEHERFQSMGLGATLDELVHFSNIDDYEAMDLAAHVPLAAENRATPPLWWLTRIANTKRPLQEKMTLFWHGLLTSQLSVVRDPIAMVKQNEFFRSHAFDSFATILRGITMDPAMMVYLNMDGSVRNAPNENYARELMELYSLGEGNYSEQDVREASRAFTGWQVQRNRLEGNNFTLEPAIFRQPQFDTGTKAFLGRTGNFRPDDIVDIIVEQPTAAEYITRRLFDFFIYPDPSEKDLAPFVDVFSANNRRIGPVVEAMLHSDLFYSPKAYRALVKSPIEYAVSAVKALGGQAVLGQYLGTQPQGNQASGGLLGAMGQIPFEPPNVAGWAGGSSWLNSTTMFARLNFIHQLTYGPQGPASRQGRQQPPPQLAPPGGLGTPSQALAHYLPLVLDDNLPPEGRQVLIEYAGDAEAALKPEQLRGLVYLILGSPQFHLS